MNNFRQCNYFIIITLAGCVTSTRIADLPQPQLADDQEEVDVIPPVPTFLTPEDCELAYGSGACGSGAQIYAKTGLVAPAGAGVWYAPFAFGAMSGVLVNRYYAKPTIYISTIRYRSFISPVVVEKYRHVTRSHMEIYDRAPHSVKSQAIISGPARYKPPQVVMTNRPHTGAAEKERGGPSSDSRRPSPISSPPRSSESTTIAAPNQPATRPPTPSQPIQPPPVQNQAIQLPPSQRKVIVEPNAQRPISSTTTGPKQVPPASANQRQPSQGKASQNPAQPTPTPTLTPTPPKPDAKACNANFPKSPVNCAI